MSGDDELWSERFRPTTTTELVGNGDVVAAIKRYVAHRASHVRPLLLSGPPGVGKTSAAHAALRDAGYTIVEVNASDLRTPQQLMEEIQPVLATRRTLLQTASGKAGIVLDELDGATPAAVSAIAKLYDDGKRTVPIICICNDAEAKVIVELRKKHLPGMTHLGFTKVSLADMLARLRHVAVAAGAKGCLPGDVVRDLLEGSNGDLRQLLVAAQMACTGGGKATAAAHANKDAALPSDAFGYMRAFLQATAAGNLDEAGRLCEADPRTMHGMLHENGLGTSSSLTAACDHLDALALSDVMMPWGGDYVLSRSLRDITAASRLNYPRLWKKRRNTNR